MAGRLALDETQLPRGPSQVPATSSGVRVFVRLRPLDDESDIQMFEYPQSERPGLVTIKDPLSSGRSEHTFEFGTFFWPSHNQDHVFTTVAEPIVEAALQGSSGCILAYGQTGSGKTYSIFGATNSQQRGLLPRSVELLFDRWEPDSTTIKDPSTISKAMNSSVALRTGISVSFLEIYLDQVYDLGRFSLEEESLAMSRSQKSRAGGRSASASRSLLSGQFLSTIDSMAASSSDVSSLRNRLPGPAQGREGLEIREGTNGIAQVKGLSRIPVHNYGEVQHIIDCGVSRRATARTASNSQSSRSHTVFTVYLPKKDQSRATSGPSFDDTDVETGDSVTLSFVDLAGSERLAKSKAEGVHFQEAVSINSSLTALGKVILALATEPAANRHVPYRDSKLTRILSPAFAVGANVSLLATLHPREENYEECLATLSWSDRCKNLQRQPNIMYISKKKHAQMKIAELQAEITSLKAQIEEAKKVTAAQMSNCGVAGVGVSKKVDEVEMQIAKAIISDNPGARAEHDSVSRASGSASGSARAVSQVPTGESTPAGGGSTKHKSSADILAAQERQERRDQTARERSIAALVALQEERGRQAEAHDKADLQMAMLEKERERLNEMEQKRAVVTVGLQREGMALNEELEKVQEKLRAALAAQAQQHELEIGEVRDETVRRLKQADETLLRIPTQLKMTKEVVERKKEEAETALQASEDQHKERVRKLKKDHEGELKSMASSIRTLLVENETGQDGMIKDIKELKENHDKLVMQCQTELLSLYEIILKFAKLAADIDAGKYPFVWRAGGKEVVLPEGLRPALPKPEDYPQLFDAIPRDEDKNSGERLHQWPPSSGRWRRTGSGGLAAVAAAEAIRKESEDAAMEEVSEQTIFDARAFAHMFREAVEDNDSDKMMSKLEASNLRQLCIELRSQSIGVFDPAAEREALRKSALDALQDGATQYYIRDLERRRSVEQAALNDVVERGLQLRTCLSGRQSTTPQHSISRLGSKSLSRPGSASVGGRSQPGSQAGSRPGTAKGSRPPPQPGYPTFGA